MKGVWLHLALLLGALGFAYQTWTRPAASEAGGQPRESEREVIVWEVAAESIKSIDLMGEKKLVRLERRTEGGEAWLWGTVEREKPAPKKTEETPESLSKVEEGATTRKAFLVGEAGDKLVASLSTLRALRALGKLDAARKQELGLDAPKETLRVISGAVTHALRLGGKVYGGSDRYAEYVKTGEAFVVGGDALRDLDAAESRLVEREVHRFKPDAVKAMAVKRGDRARALVRGGVDAKALFWADAGKPDAKDETAGNWVAKLDRLKVTDYVEDQAADAAESVAPEPVVRVEYAGAGGESLGFLELQKTPSEKDGKFDYQARTEHTRGLVKVSQFLGEQVEQDLDAVLAK